MVRRMPSSTKGVEPELQLSTSTTTRCGDGGSERVVVNRGRSRTRLPTCQGGVWSYKKRTTEDENIEKREVAKERSREATWQPCGFIIRQAASEQTYFASFASNY